MELRTNQKKTMEALNDRYLADNGRIDESFLNHELSLLINNDQTLYLDAVKNRRVRPHSVAWRALTLTANQTIDGYWGAEEYYASSPQLKNWLNQYGRGYDSIAQTVSEVEEMRRED